MGRWISGTVVFFVVGSAQVFGDGEPATEWQQDRLLSPNERQLAQEASGNVFIYDGLDIDTVETAMDRHFERIEHMMFTRIHHPPPEPSGAVYIEEDGCD